MQIGDLRHILAVHHRLRILHTRIACRLLQLAYNITQRRQPDVFVHILLNLNTLKLRLVAYQIIYADPGIGGHTGHYRITLGMHSGGIKRIVSSVYT